MPAKLRGHPRFLSSKPREDKLSREGANHHPFAWKTPTPPGGLRTPKVTFCAFFFLAWFKYRRCSWTVWIAMCLNHFVLIAICSAEFLVVCLRICTGFQDVSFRETHLWEDFGRTDQIALITCLKKLKRIKRLSDISTGQTGHVDGIVAVQKWGVFRRISLCLLVAFGIFSLVRHRPQAPPGRWHCRFTLQPEIIVRGPQMGGQIRRGRIWRFWGAPISRPEVPEPFKNRYLGTLDWKSGRPKDAKSYHDGSDSPFAALWYSKIS